VSRFGSCAPGAPETAVSAETFPETIAAATIASAFAWIFADRSRTYPSRLAQSFSAQPTYTDSKSDA